MATPIYDESRPECSQPNTDTGISWLEVAAILAPHWRKLIAAPLLGGVLAYGLTMLVAPTYTARTSFLPPQQQQSSAASALASIGALAGLAGAMGSSKSPTEQYVALMESVRVSDKLIDQYKLQEVYDVELRSAARRKLGENVRITPGKKDGLIYVEVDDLDAKRAADIANSYVSELRAMTAELAVTEAQQRRVFFESQLLQSKQKLVEAQEALQRSGFSPGALKAEPKAAAEAYAKLRAEATTAEVKLQMMRSFLNDEAAEVRQARSTLSALRSELAKLEQNAAAEEKMGDYVGKYREFKYQETLFELFARQFELAKVDEGREGGLIQVVDPAIQPDRRSKPKRLIIAALVTVLTFISVVAFALLKSSMAKRLTDPAEAAHWSTFKAAFKSQR